MAFEERVPAVTPERFRQLTIVTLWFLVVAVVSGAVVRLTQSGLGCIDWPSCTSHRIVASWQFHPQVEFINRMINVGLTLAIVATVLAAFMCRPRRPDHVRLAMALVLGVVADIVLGGMVVLFKLNPVLVQSHFLLSMALLGIAVVLARRTDEPQGPRRPRVTSQAMRLGWAAVALAGVVIVTGTVVTGSGPHAGDARAKRLPFSVHATAQIHGTSVFVFLAVVIALAWSLQREAAPDDVMHSVRTLLVVLLVQAAIGYTQYFTGIPALLVALHVLGVCLVWLAVLQMLLGLSVPVPESARLAA